MKIHRTTYFDKLLCIIKVVSKLALVTRGVQKNFKNKNQQIRFVQIKKKCNQNKIWKWFEYLCLLEKIELGHASSFLEITVTWTNSCIRSLSFFYFWCKELKYVLCRVKKSLWLWGRWKQMKVIVLWFWIFNIVI